jgi:hypothetical protein
MEEYRRSGTTGQRRGVSRDSATVSFTNMMPSSMPSCRMRFERQPTDHQINKFRNYLKSLVKGRRKEGSNGVVNSSRRSRRNSVG